ncbi:MAG: hypothetical protein E7043_04320 [Lentisphaerae bacterium]|nr:hypothetical protein [Lentisphaerota bacterium]
MNIITYFSGNLNLFWHNNTEKWHDNSKKYSFAGAILKLCTTRQDGFTAAADLTGGTFFQ